MPKNLDIERKVCSFCGKDQSKVRKMVAGPGGVFICDECVELCSDIMFGEETTSPIFSIESLPKPAEIKGAKKMQRPNGRPKCINIRADE